MVHVLATRSTKLSKFLWDNKVSQRKLLKHIISKAVERKEIPICYSTLNKIVNEWNSYPKLEFMIQIRDGLSSYIGRAVSLDEIIEL